MFGVGPQYPVSSVSSETPLLELEPCVSQRDIHIYFQRVPWSPAPEVICSLLLDSGLPLPIPAFPPNSTPSYTP